MANRSPSITLALMVALASMVVAPTRTAAQPNMHPGPASRFMPLEHVVFPRDPSESRALAQKMRAEGFLVLSRAPMSGMIIAAVPLEGMEEIMCQYVKGRPEVMTAERNVRGEMLGRQPVPNCAYVNPVATPCNAGDPGLPYPDLQLSGPVPAPAPGHPNDPAFFLQWGLKNTGQALMDRSQTTTTPGFSGIYWPMPAVPGIDINALPAWNFTTGSPLITVAVLDSGTEYCNPDFDPARFLYPDMALTCIGNELPISYPCCTASSSEESCIFGPARDNVGHGTIVASIIAGTVNNNVGIAGIDQQCRILSARVFGANHTHQNNFTTANAARLVTALEFIATLPAYSSVRVINMSVWLPLVELDGTAQLSAFNSVLATLRAQNRFVVTGSGNGGVGTADTGMPAASPHVVTVGAMDATGRRVVVPPSGVYSSSTGLSLDFMAPGMAEMTLICQSNPCPAPECAYPTFECFVQYHSNFLWGTSFAAPKVAAAISLILAEAIEIGVLNPQHVAGLDMAAGVRPAQSRSP